MDQDELETGDLYAFYEVQKRLDQAPFYKDLQHEPGANTELISSLIEATAPASSHDWTPAS